MINSHQYTSKRKREVELNRRLERLLRAKRAIQSCSQLACQKLLMGNKQIQILSTSRNSEKALISTLFLL